MPGTTLIRNADWIVAYDREADGHAYLRNADVAFTDDTVAHVGKDYDGEAEQIIDGEDLYSSSRNARPSSAWLHGNAWQGIFRRPRHKAYVG